MHDNFPPNKSNYSNTLCLRKIQGDVVDLDPCGDKWLHKLFDSIVGACKTLGGPVAADVSLAH